MNAPSDDKIGQLLTSAAMKAKAESADTLKAIKDGFGPAMANVKEKLGDSWGDVKTIYQMAFDKNFAMKKETKYAVIGALAYLVSPIDLLPERVLGPLGYLDDVAVLMWALKYAQPEIERYRNHLAAVETGSSGDSPAA